MIYGNKRHKLKSTKIDCHLNQLSFDRSLDFTSTQVDLSGITLAWNGVGAKIRSREVYTGSGLLFGFVRQSPSKVRVCGKELDYGNAVLFQRGEEVEYIAPTGLTSLIIYVAPEITDLLGWNLAGGIYRPVPAVRLLNLDRTCRSATLAARRQVGHGITAAVHSQSFQNDTLWRDRILEVLEPALEPWSMSPPAPGKNTLPGMRQLRLVKDLEHFYEQRDLTELVTVDDAAESLGIPRRTLFHEFRSYLGLGPHRYLQLVRLHRLRDRLLAGSLPETSVTKLAGEVGFRHLGRLSAAYYKHFGEYPSETLRRERCWR